MGIQIFYGLKNLITTNVVTAPTPATSGASMTVTTGDGSKFPSGFFLGVICPANTYPTSANAEIVLAAASGDTISMVRAQDGSTARSVVTGDTFFHTATALQQTAVKNYSDQYRVFGTPSVSDSATSGTTEQLLYQATIPANLAAASTLRLEVTGVATGTTPTMQMNLRFGTAGTTADTLVAQTAVSSAFTSGAGWMVKSDLTCRTTGGTGTLFGRVELSIDGLNNIVATTSAAATISTLVTNKLSLFVVPGGTSPVVTRHIGFLETPNP